MPTDRWWRGGVIYQVYLPTFADGNGDGVGDFAGLTERLEYLSWLGVDAVWLSPCHPSAGVDGGYDVTDLAAIDPIFGGLPAFDRFVAQAHQRGLRVLMDFVANHTSDRHAWFREAMADPASPKRKWYVFRDGRRDGPPNNWLSRFGGPAWQRVDGQWYLHSYYVEQPDLDWHNPEVRQALADVLGLWVDRGVDGFRLDAVHRIAKDPALRDNPRRPGTEAGAGWDSLVHLYDHNHPLIADYLKVIRQAVGPERVLLGEVFLSEDTGGAGSYLGPDRLDLAFHFPFAASPWQARSLAAEVARAEARFPPGFLPAWHLSNHDGPRHATRFGQRAIRPAAVVLLTLRGTTVLYQGEEIGMVDGQVPQGHGRDRLGRDPCRTPVQWEASPNAGFCPSGVRPYLPLAAGYQQRNVVAQRDDPASTLSLYRRLIALRHLSPALRRGRYRPLQTPAGAWAYRREADGEAVLVAVSFADEPLELDVPPGQLVLSTDLRRAPEQVPGPLRLGPDEAVVLLLDG